MPNVDKIYLDANFLVAYFVNNHSDHNASKILFFNLLKQNSSLYISTLGLDEAWFKIWEASQPNTTNRKPFKDFYSIFKGVLTQLQNLSTMNIIQFENDFHRVVENSIENIGNFSLRPRDAFHLAYMQDLGINQIITKDKKFDHVSGITVTSF